MQLGYASLSLPFGTLNMMKLGNGTGRDDGQMVEGRTDVNVEIVTMQIMVAFKLRFFSKWTVKGKIFSFFLN